MTSSDQTSACTQGSCDTTFLIGQLDGRASHPDGPYHKSVTGPSL
jgi:hypothetical protein